MPTTVPFPFEFLPLDKDDNTAIIRDFTGFPEGMCRTNPGGWILSPRFKKYIDDIYNLELRADDIWILTFPRSGTTVLQEMTWLVNNSADFEGAKTVLDERSPYIETGIWIDDVPSLEVQQALKAIQSDPQMEKWRNSVTSIAKAVDTVKKLPSPRIIKSHLPLECLPQGLLNKCKVIYVARNPKDVVVSYYHHMRLIKAEGFQRDFATFFEYFMKDLIHYGPYWPHILQAWELRNHDNMLFLFYEDMIKDMPSTIRMVASFSGKSLTEEQVSALSQHLHIDSFKNNPAVNLEIGNILKTVNEGEAGFIRKGVTGDWKNYFTQEMSDQMDDRIKKNTEGTDLTFPVKFELTV